MRCIGTIIFCKSGYLCIIWLSSPQKFSFWLLTTPPWLTAPIGDGNGNFFQFQDNQYSRLILFAPISKKRPWLVWAVLEHHFTSNDITGTHKEVYDVLFQVKWKQQRCPIMIGQCRCIIFVAVAFNPCLNYNIFSQLLWCNATLLL